MICSKCGKEFSDGKKSTMCPDCRSKMGKRNKRKGNANELRFAKYLQKQFDKYGLKYRARRTPRSGAIHEFEPADIMLSGMKQGSIFKKIHFENKNTAQWAIEEWFKKVLDQEEENGTNREPALIIRKPNSVEEYAVISMEFLVHLLVSIDHK